jgi:hypothetical protein
MAAKKSKKKKLRRGKKMTKGSGWDLIATSGRKRRFKGTLLKTINFGTKRLAIFSVPKRMS